MQKFLKLTVINFGLILALNGTAMAQQTFGPESYPYATEAQSLQRANDHKKAIKALKKGLKLGGLSPYEASTLYKMLGTSYYARGKNEDAIEAFQNAIQAGGLTRQDATDVQANIAQLNIAEKSYALGAQQLEAYFNAGGVQKSKLVKMTVQAHLQAKNREAAVPWAEVMMRQGLIQSRKDHELAIYLFDSPEKRFNQMQIANGLYRQYPNDPDVIARIKRLNVKAQRDGVPVIAIAGQ